MSKSKITRQNQRIARKKRADLLKTLAQSSILLNGSKPLKNPTPIPGKVVKVIKTITGNPGMDSLLGDQFTSIDELVNANNTNASAIDGTNERLTNTNEQMRSFAKDLESHNVTINKTAHELSEVNGKLQHDEIKKKRNRRRAIENAAIVGYSILCLGIIGLILTFYIQPILSLSGTAILIAYIYAFETYNSGFIIANIDQLIGVLTKGIAKLPMFDNPDGREKVEGIIEKLQSQIIAIDSESIGNRSYRLAYFGLLLAAQIGAAVATATTSPPWLSISSTVSIPATLPVPNEPAPMYRFDGNRVLFKSPNS